MRCYGSENYFEGNCAGCFLAGKSREMRYYVEGHHPDTEEEQSNKEAKAGSHLMEILNKDSDSSLQAFVSHQPIYCGMA